MVGDVHGNAKALCDVFARIDADRATARAKRIGQIFLGDYVDRGPASREVVELLLERLSKGNLVLLKGNHEAMFTEFLQNPQYLENGATMAAYKP